MVILNTKIENIFLTTVNDEDYISQFDDNTLETHDTKISHELFKMLIKEIAIQGVKKIGTVVIEDDGEY